VSWLGGPVSPVFESSNVSSMLCQCVVHCVQSSKSPSTKNASNSSAFVEGRGKTGLSLRIWLFFCQFGVCVY
jgi:hypothetical protein